LIPYRERSFVEFDVYTRKFTSYGDFELTDLKFQTATYVPQIRKILAFHRRLKGVVSVEPEEQYLFYYDSTRGYEKGTTTVPRLRMTPKVHPLEETIIFHDTSTLARLQNPADVDTDLRKDMIELTYTSPVIPGVVSWYEQFQDDWIITSSYQDTLSIIVPSQGGFCGAKSFSKSADLFAGIKNNGSFLCRTGTETLVIPFIFDNLFGDGETGVLGVYSDANRSYSFYRDIEVNRVIYNVLGDTGSTFSIGRIFGQQYSEESVPGISTTLSGLLSEVLVFKSDVKRLATTIGESQNYYFRESGNIKLKNLL
jgi:hypothetical protein